MGSSIEFSGYRAYTPGDDPRQIDWNIYARSRQFQIKLRQAEEALAVWLLIDCSASMADKFTYARGLGAALGYVALAGGDEVRLSLLGDGRSSPVLTVLGRRHYSRLTDQLASFGTAGSTQLLPAVRQLRGSGGPHGVCFLISDLYDRDSQRAIGELANAGHEVCVLHLISDDDRDPPVPDNAVLIDAETGTELVLDGSVDARANYRAGFAEWLGGLGRSCRRMGVAYLQLPGDGDPGAALLGPLRRAGRLL